jgi:hypothetical protein
MSRAACALVPVHLHVIEPESGGVAHLPDDDGQRGSGGDFGEWTVER